MDDPIDKYENNEKPSNKTSRLAIAPFLLAILLITIGAFYIGGRNLNRLVYAPMEKMRACGDNMSQLRSALRDYASNNSGRLPTGSRWCDILREEMKVSQGTFICQTSNIQVGQSSYALNQNIAGMKLTEIPRDVVLLFESTPGWNQTGGPELIRSDNHIVAQSERFNVILIRDRVVGYSKGYENELRWKP
jgi:hypothetical protein